MIRYYFDIEQGTDEWHQLRCGVVTASQVKTLLTGKTLKVANNDTVRQMAFDIAAQRETQHVEDHYQNYQMIRGHLEETLARDVYSENFYPVQECGFITNDNHDMLIGYSPDGLVGKDGLIEIKSRIQKFQVRTILEDEVPSEYMLQIQTGLYVSERKWCDFVSYSNGMPLYVKRVEPIAEVQQAIDDAAYAFYKRVGEIQEDYRKLAAQMVKTERVDLSFDDEMMMEEGDK